MTALTDYTIRVERDALDDGDPIPWAYAVLDGDEVLFTGWAGTEAEAYEYAEDERRRYFEGDWPE